MLLEKKGFNEGDVVSMKLSSGEELVAKFVSEDSDSYKIEKTLMLAMSQKGLGMAPYMMTVNPDSKLNINKRSVIVIAQSDSDIAAQYTLQTTGIQPVSSADFMR
jgi:hypothetical protein